MLPGSPAGLGCGGFASVSQPLNTSCLTSLSATEFQKPGRSNAIAPPRRNELDCPLPPPSGAASTTASGDETLTLLFLTGDGRGKASQRPRSGTPSSRWWLLIGPGPVIPSTVRMARPEHHSHWASSYMHVLDLTKSGSNRPPHPKSLCG